MSDLATTRSALDTAEATDREADRLRSRLTALRAECDAAREEVDRLAAAHDLEERDVARLEGIGLSAVLAAVRGTRTGELDRERAEEVRARYALQAATRRLADLEARRDDTDLRVAALGDTRARREQAREAHAAVVAASGAAPALEGVLDDVTTVRASLVEVEEAQAAGRRAAQELDGALELLGSADSWSAYDTWFGGGMISSAVKHDRLDEAGRRVAQAQDALLDFARELADVGPAQALRADLGVTPTTRTVDIFFDNIFTDLSVRSRIKESLAAVGDARRQVGAAMDRLATTDADLRRREAELLARRDALLADA